MSFYKFDEDDLFTNTIEAYPQYRFYTQSGSIYINDMPHLVGANTDNNIGVPKGFVSLYEYNIDRPVGNLIYPFIIKDGHRDTLKTISKQAYNATLLFGETSTGSYSLSASISRDYYSATTRARVNALQNTLNHYNYLSPHYQYSSAFGNKATQPINLISIPSILYGSRIKKGSISLKYYVTGTLVGELQDRNYNGELVQVGPEGSTGSGSVAGVALYREGFLLLTGSWSLNAETIQTDANGPSKWIHFNYGANDGNSPVLTTLSASFAIDYQGTTDTQTMTMFATAPYGELNHSNNPTYLDSTETQGTSTGSLQYMEQPRKIKNIVESAFLDVEPDFIKTTYISKIALYDEDKNLIGIAKVATPVRKTEEKQYTFKLKLDI
tara:strand:+ start:4295 stop:5440 length:1146 start_codon:yes stop_codon:yes gene_type:complete